jgi:hypothetical protein
MLRLSGSLPQYRECLKRRGDDAELADGLQPFDDADQIPLARRCPGAASRKDMTKTGNLRPSDQQAVTKSGGKSGLRGASGREGGWRSCEARCSQAIDIFKALLQNPRMRIGYTRVSTDEQWITRRSRARCALQTLTTLPLHDFPHTST